MRLKQARWRVVRLATQLPYPMWLLADTASPKCAVQLPTPLVTHCGVVRRASAATCWLHIPSKLHMMPQPTAGKSSTSASTQCRTPQQSTQPTSHSIFHAAAPGHSTAPPAPAPPVTAAPGTAAARMLQGVRCAMLSRGPYSPAMSTRLATLVRKRLAEKVCRQQRPLQEYGTQVQAARAVMA